MIIVNLSEARDRDSTLVDPFASGISRLVSSSIAVVDVPHQDVEKAPCGAVGISPG